MVNQPDWITISAPGGGGGGGWGEGGGRKHIIYNLGFRLEYCFSARVCQHA